MISHGDAILDLPGFIPEELRQLARFVPMRGWDAVDWKPLLGSLRKLSWRYVSGQGVSRLRRAAATVTPDVDVVAALRDARPLADVTGARERRRYGDALLQLYFSQWLLEDGLFLDLRVARFGVRDDRLQFSPNGLWIALRPEFRAGMLGLYRSFYTSDDDAFEAALRQMGMLRPGMSSAAEDELKALLYSHFGIEQHAQRFSIDAFKASFDELFEFFLANNYRLHSDFVFVGFYLITLYLALEQGGQAHNVRKICARALL